MTTTGTKRIRDDDLHQYALNEKCEWVHARDASKGVSYYCDCPERHKLKWGAPSGREGKRPFAHYFAHYGKTTCMSNGESMIHRLAKHRIRELASTLSFDTERCPKCQWTKQFHSDGHTVQIEVRSMNKRWWYDCLLFNAIGKAVFVLEVVKTHFSSSEKIKSTRSNENGRLGFAEFMADDVMESMDGRLHNMELVECLDCPNCRELTKAEMYNSYLKELHQVQQMDITSSLTDMAMMKLQVLIPDLLFILEECGTCGWTERFNFKYPSNINKGHHAIYDNCYGCCINNSAGTLLYKLQIQNPWFSSNGNVVQFAAEEVLKSIDGQLTNLHIRPILDCPQCKSDAKLYLGTEVAGHHVVAKVEVCEMYRCYLEEIDQLQRMEITIDHGYRYLWRNQALKPKKRQFKKKPRGQHGR